MDFIDHHLQFIGGLQDFMRQGNIQLTRVTKVSQVGKYLVEGADSSYRSKRVRDSIVVFRYDFIFDKEFDDFINFVLHNIFLKHG